MAEQKKRGRPPKDKTVKTVSESTESIKMKTNDTTVSKTNDTTVSIGDVGSKLKQIFGRMASSNIPYQNFADAMQRSPLDMGVFLNNPFIQNARIKNSNSQIIPADKLTITRALENPGGSEALLRGVSMSLFYNNYVYQNLIRLNRDVPQMFYYTIPQYIDKKEFSNEKFKKQKRFVDIFLDKFDIPLTYKTVALQVAREGKCSYVFRDSHDTNKGIVDFAVLQKLPPQYVKYTGFGSDSPLIVSLDFMMFNNTTYSITQWPPWFNEIWEQLKENGTVNIDPRSKTGYRINPTVDNSNIPNMSFESINGTYALYVELPQDLVYTFGSDLGDVLAIPEYAGLFSDLSELDAYKTLQQQTLLTNITNVLTAEVPVEKDAKGGSDAAILSPEVIMGLEGDCSTALNSNIFPFFAPLTNFKMHGVEKIPAATQIVLDAVRNVMSTAGTSGLINTNDKPSVAMIKGEQTLMESKTEYLTLQFTKFINIIINKYLGLDYRFKVVIWGGAYNWKDEVKVLKEMVQNGHKGLMPRLLSAYRMTVDEYALEYAYVDDLGIIPETKQTSESSNVVGRPAQDDSEINNDNTAASKEQGGNVSEVK